MEPCDDLNSTGENSAHGPTGPPLPLPTGPPLPLPTGADGSSLEELIETARDLKDLMDEGNAGKRSARDAFAETGDRDADSEMMERDGVYSLGGDDRIELDEEH